MSGHESIGEVHSFGRHFVQDSPSDKSFHLVCVYGDCQTSSSFTACLTLLLAKQRIGGGGSFCLPWSESALSAVERAKVSLGG